MSDKQPRKTHKVTNWDELVEATKSKQNLEDASDKKTLVLFMTLSTHVEEGKPYHPSELYFAEVSSLDRTPFMDILTECCEAERGEQVGKF